MIARAAIIALLHAVVGCSIVTASRSYGGAYPQCNRPAGAIVIDTALAVGSGVAAVRSSNGNFWYGTAIYGASAIYGINGYRGCAHAEALYERGLPSETAPLKPVDICVHHEDESSCVASVRPLLEGATAAFRAREFSRAVALHERAYHQIPHPILLFNRAEVYRAWAISLCAVPQENVTGNTTCKQARRAALKDYRMFLLLSPHDSIRSARARQIIYHWRP